MRHTKPRRPVWPRFVFERLNQAGIALLEREYEDFKTARRFPRTTRISAEDFATIFVDRLIANGRTELLRRAA